MYKGDLSNSAPKRVLVNAEVLFIKVPVVEKKFKIFKKKSEHLAFDKFLLNKLFLYTTRAGVTLEMVSFEYRENDLELIYNNIERAGVNPFRGFSYYPSPRKLAADLAYRPEVIGVIDPDHQLMYGHLGMDF
jgi:hypothetical protein